MREGLKILKKIYSSGGKTFISKQLFTVKKEVVYTKNIPLGYLDYYRANENPQLYYINFKTSHRILILGATGSGKSWITRALMNRLHLAGIPSLIFDPSPEYYTSMFPLQEEFRRFILRIEEPKTITMKVYYPYFLYKYMGLDLPNQTIFQFNIKDIKPTDLTAFIDYEKLSFSAKLEIEDLIVKLTKQNKIFSDVDELINYISEKEDISNNTKKFLIKSFTNLKELGIFGTKIIRKTNLEDNKEIENINECILEDINNQISVNINLFGWQRIDFKKYVAVYISLILRELLMAKELKKLKKQVCVIIEEAHEFVPKRSVNKSQEITKEAIRDIVFMGRKQEISSIFITQKPETIDPAIIEQCDLILIPKGFETYKLKEIVKNYLPSYYSTPYEFSIDIARETAMLRRWKDGARDWLVLEKGGDMYRITPLGPLSAHKTEGFVLKE
jgi:DNA helicase HerA-like ATPase